MYRTSKSNDRDCPSMSSESLVNKDRLGGRVWDYMTHRRGEYGV